MSGLDDEIRAMLLERAAHADASGIREQAIAAARSTPQLHPLARPAFTRPALRLAGGLAGLAVVGLAVVIAVAVLSPLSRGPGGALVGGSASPAAASSASSPSPTDVPVTPPPYVAGPARSRPSPTWPGGRPRRWSSAECAGAGAASPGEQACIRRWLSCPLRPARPSPRTRFSPNGSPSARRWRP